MNNIVVVKQLSFLVQYEYSSTACHFELHLAIPDPDPLHSWANAFVMAHCSWRVRNALSNWMMENDFVLNVCNPCWDALIDYL